MGICRMTQAAQVIQLLKEGPKTLGQFRNTPVFYELRSRISELRSQGYEIIHHRYRYCDYCSMRRTDCPAHVIGQNVYKLHAEPPKVEANGQMAFA